MALSPADFYAYSRATGAPIPEDAQERAAMAPEVLEFRRNQLKAPQQESNTLQTLGTAALGLGAAIGAGLTARRFLGGRSKAAFEIPKAPPKSATAGVTQADLSNLQKAAGRPEASAPQPRRIPLTPEQQQRMEAAKRRSPLYQQEVPPSKTAYVPFQEATPPAPEPGTPAYVEYEQLAETYSPETAARAAARGTFEERLAQTGVQGEAPSTGTTENALAIDPTARLIEEWEQRKAARKKELEDRMSQAYSRRMKTAEELLTQLQAAGPDLTTVQQATAPARSNQFANAVQSGEDQMTGRMKMQLSRNEDLDMSQVELLENMAAENEAMMRDYAEPAQMQGFVTDEAINEAASQLPDGLPVDQAEGTRRLSAQEMADIARDKMIALRQEVARQSQRPKTIRTKSGKLRVVPESTERSERQLAKTWTNKPIPGAEPGSTAFRQLQEQGQVELTLPGVIRSAVERVEELPEEEGLEMKFLRSVPNVGPAAEVTSTAAGTAIRGASPVYETVEPQQKTRQIFGNPDVLVPGAPDETMPDYPGSYSALHQILSKSDLPERIDPYAEKRLAGGSAGIGVHGPELSYVPGAMSKITGEYSKAATRVPTFVPKWLQEREGPTGFGAMTTAQILSGAQKAPEGRVRNAFEAELNRRRVASRSTAVSEVLRRGRVEGTLLPEPLNVNLGPAKQVFSIPESIRVVPQPLKKSFM